MDSAERTKRLAALDEHELRKRAAVSTQGTLGVVLASMDQLAKDLAQSLEQELRLFCALGYSIGYPLVDSARLGGLDGLIAHWLRERARVLAFELRTLERAHATAQGAERARLRRDIAFCRGRWRRTVNEALANQGRPPAFAATEKRLTARRRPPRGVQLADGPDPTPALETPSSS